jgi:hypothetical protein
MGWQHLPSWQISVSAQQAPLQAVPVHGHDFWLAAQVEFGPQVPQLPPQPSSPHFFPLQLGTQQLPSMQGWLSPQQSSPHSAKEQTQVFSGEHCSLAVQVPH